MSDAADLYADALAWARARNVVLPDDYYGKLPLEARNKAFSVAGVARLDQLQAVRASLDAALAAGQTFAAWKKTAAAKGLGLPAHRLDNIFRTNIQSAYMAGIARQQESPAALAARPFFQYDAINDSRTRPAHAALDNVIAPADSPFWRTHTAVLGYRCRCTRIALTEAQAMARGYDPAKPLPDVQPDPGFAGHPLADDGWAGVNAARAQRLERAAPGPVREAFVLRYVPPAEIVGRNLDQPAVIEAAASLRREIGDVDYDRAERSTRGERQAGGLLQEHEAVALYLWSGDIYYAINTALWKHALPDAQIRALLPIIEPLRSAVAKLANATPQPAKLYRGIKKQDRALAERYRKAFESGDAFRFNSFSSFTTDKEIARAFAGDDGFILEIDNPTGEKIAAPVERYSRKRHEREWLMADGKVFKADAQPALKKDGREWIKISASGSPAGGVMPNKNFAGKVIYREKPPKGKCYHIGRDENGERIYWEMDENDPDDAAFIAESEAERPVPDYKTRDEWPEDMKNLFDKWSHQPDR